MPRLVVALFELPWTFYLAGVAAVLSVGIAKAGFGGGVGVVATPLLLLGAPENMPAATTVAILLPVLCVCDWFSLPYYLRTCDWRLLAHLLPGAGLGVIAGTLLIGQVSSHALKAGIGLLSVVFVLDQALRPALLGRAAHWPTGWPMGTLFGSLAGFASMLAHAGGPPATIYLLPHLRDRRFFVGTCVVFFTLLNAVKLLPFAALGLFDLTVLGLSAVLALFVPLGVWLGVQLNRTVKDRPFRIVMFGLLLVTGIQLCWKGLWAN